MKPSIFLWSDSRKPIESLQPHLRMSLQGGNEKFSRMQRSEMRPGEAKTCRWVGFGIGKGCSSASLNISVFGIPEHFRSGLHGRMVQGFCDVDSYPSCYEDTSEKGFSDFVRWVYFADPDERQDFFGVDFSLDLKLTSGVATSFKTVSTLVSVAVRHGLPSETEVVLLNCRMCEPDYLTKTRKLAKLRYAADWQRMGPTLFAMKSHFCPRCGQKTLNRKVANYCFRCGSKVALFYT